MNSAQCVERENAAARFRKLQTFAQASRDAANLCRGKGFPETAKRHEAMAAEHETAAAMVAARYGLTS